jgi:hypothetical protein
MKTFNAAALITTFFLIAGLACKKSDAPSGGGGGGTNPPPPAPIVLPTIPKTDSTYNPVDPATPQTVGFFLNGWPQKTFTAPATTTGAIDSAVTDVLVVNVNNVIAKVPAYVFGNNSNLWTGQYTNANLIQYIKDMNPGIIRAPAGSISDVYFWNGTSANPRPADAPNQLYSSGAEQTQYWGWYGGNIDGGSLSLANYYNLLQQTNSTGIITVNYGYARYGTSADPVATAAHLAADWVRHDNGRTKFWEVGNETYGNWEAGFQIDPGTNQDHQPDTVTGALYGQHFNVFYDSMHLAATQIGATIYVGATLVDAPAYNGAYPTLGTWNAGVLANAGTAADFFIIHDYFTAYNTNSNISDIMSTATTVPTSGMNYVKQQMAGAGVATKPIALTEWNIQAVGSRQDISYIAGMHAVKTFGAILKNGFGEASRWDLANGWGATNTSPSVPGDDMGLFSYGQPNVPDFTPRPAFFYQYYFGKFFGDRMVSDSGITSSDLTTYSSTFSSGQAGTVIINSGTNKHVVDLNFHHFPAGAKYYWYVLTGGIDNGSFSGQVLVNGTGPSASIAAGGPLNYSTLQAYSAPLSGSILVTVPPLSVVYLVVDKK